ncbi:MAG: hypothetical protein Q4D81_12285 [Eubacteriales bacterium]|nr:hypothetical protein [Eubacteriales bacterium]
MSLDLTHGSAMAYETILYGNMTPKMAAEYLREERISIRSFSDTLRGMYPYNDIRRRLKRFYRENQIDGRQRSMDRKIQNWISGRNQPTNREDFFRIAFALGLTEMQLNFLLGICTDYGIQYRDGQEVVLAWFLRNGYGYQEAMVFLNGLSVPETEAGIPADFSGKECNSHERFESSAASAVSAKRELGEAKNSANDNTAPDSADASAPDSAVATAAPGSGNSEEGAVAHTCPEQECRHAASRIPAGINAFNAKGYTEVSRITHEIRNEFQLARTVEELRTCYLRNLDRFGQIHLRSYYYFRQYLKQLIQPLSVAGEDEMDYSIDTVMGTYLTLQMPAGKKRSNYSLVQKLIKHNWPNITSVRNIRSQQEDVPRKLLLLLYVVTENSDYRGDYSEFDEDYISLEERVEDHWWTLNAMLTDCGMAPLDLPNAFDWLILYAVSTSGEESMSGRLEGVINELFRDVDRDV